MNEIKAYFAGAGIGSLAGAVFLIRDAQVPGKNITLYEDLPISGGSCDGIEIPGDAYLIRGGRMLNLPAYECLWDLLKFIPSLEAPGKTVFQEVDDFNRLIKTHSRARLVDRHRQRRPVRNMGFSFKDRMDLLKLTLAPEDVLGTSRIDQHFRPEFFRTNFWLMWATTFAFQPWHSAVELKRYMHRFMHEFSRIETLEGVARTPLNQYDSLVRPIEKWLVDQGVNFVRGTTVVDLDVVKAAGKTVVKALVLRSGSKTEKVNLAETDLAFVQNGSMTGAWSIGDQTHAPALKGKESDPSWMLWEKLAQVGPEFGNPDVFSSRIPESTWESFTVTLKNPRFFDAMERFSGNQAGTGALVTFQDSNWFMSVVLAKQPHFRGQPEGVQVFWGYGLFPDRVGNFVAKPMIECTGEEILKELCGHLGFNPEEVFTDAICIPCNLPYITAQFVTRTGTDRPLPVPAGCVNLGLISQFVEIPNDVVFTVEYSVRAAQMAVYQLLGIRKKIPRISRHDHNPRVLLKAVATAYRKR